MYIPFVDQGIAEVKSRFDDDTEPVALRLKELLKGSKADVDAVLEAAKLYESDVESWCSCGRRHSGSYVPLRPSRLSITQRNTPRPVCS